MSVQKKNTPMSGSASAPTAAASEASMQEAQPMSVAVRIYSIPTDGAILAHASITLNGAFAVRGVKVVDSEKGPFVSMPRQKVGDEYRDVCYPLNKELRDQISGAVMDAYQQELAQITQRGQEGPAPEYASQEMTM